MFLCALWPSVGIHHKWANKQGARSNTLKTARKGLNASRERVCWIGRAAALYGIPCPPPPLYLHHHSFRLIRFSTDITQPYIYLYQPRKLVSAHNCNTRSYQHFAQARCCETAYNPENRCDIRDELIMPHPLPHHTI